MLAQQGPGARAACRLPYACRPADASGPGPACQTAAAAQLVLAWGCGKFNRCGLPCHKLARHRLVSAPHPPIHPSTHPPHELQDTYWDLHYWFCSLEDHLQAVSGQRHLAALFVADGIMAGLLDEIARLPGRLAQLGGTAGVIGQADIICAVRQAGRQAQRSAGPQHASRPAQQHSSTAAPV